MNKVHLVSHQEVMQEALQDPAFRKVWEAGRIRREITEAIISLRVKHKMSQEQLARKVGLKQPNIARIERGNIMPSISTLTRIAQAFGKDLKIQFG